MHLVLSFSLVSSFRFVCLFVCLFVFKVKMWLIIC